MFRGFLAALAAFAAAGCGGGGGYVSVSGTVTIDGKPAPGVMVIFQPTAAPGTSTAAGVGSSARTDAAGKFTLEAMTPDPRSGAVPGKHAVRIATPPKAGGDADSDVAAGGKGPPKDPIPERYNVKTELTFDVPAGGTDKADFALKSK